MLALKISSRRLAALDSSMLVSRDRGICFVPWRNVLFLVWHMGLRISQVGRRAGSGPVVGMDIGAILTVVTFNVNGSVWILM